MVYMLQSPFGLVAASQVDVKVLRCLEQVLWPHCREEVVRSAVQMGRLGFDALETAAASTRPSDAGLRYWAMGLLQYMQVSFVACARCST